MKGVILAGGTGSRLYPLTRITNKHLLPIYDRPMIAWSIEAVVSSGIDEIMLVTGGTHAGEFLRLLGNGHEYGIKQLSYAYQEKAGGIAEALGLAAHFAEGGPVLVMLADNIVERSIKPMVDAFCADPDRRAHPALEGGRARTPASPRRAGVRRHRPRGAHRGEARGAGVGVLRDRHLLLRGRRVRHHRRPRPLGPGRARDHRRQQSLCRQGPDGARRPGGLLGRRRRVDRGVLRRQRLRAAERRQPAAAVQATSGALRRTAGHSLDPLGGLPEACRRRQCGGSASAAGATEGTST